MVLLGQRPRSKRDHIEKRMAADVTTTEAIRSLRQRDQRRGLRRIPVDERTRTAAAPIAEAA